MNQFDMDFIDFRIWTYFCQSLQNNVENNKHGYWTDKDKILCKTEAHAEILADFLEDMGFDFVCTGYYDITEDTKHNTVDEYTGCWYVSIN